MSNIDRFYPSMGHASTWSAEQQLDVVAKMLVAMRWARGGYPEKESELCDMVGSIRRDHKTIGELPDAVSLAAREAVDYLRSTGRKVALCEDDPALWISRRDGSPRWSELKKFRLVPQRPSLLGNSECNVRPDVVAFIERFGKRWEKSPVEGVWWLVADGDQFTYRTGDIAHYQFESAEEFRRRFGEGLDAQYFYRDQPRWKYCVLQLMDHLKSVHG